MAEKEEARYHDANGNPVPSVTEILSEQVGWGNKALESWRKVVRMKGGDPDAIGAEAMARGTAMHKAIEDYFHGRGPTFDPLDVQAPKLFAKWREYIEEMCGDVTIHDVERPFIVTCPSTGETYAGTIDAVLAFNGVLTLVDWKTSSTKTGMGIRERYFLQVAAYTYAYNLAEREAAELENRMPICIDTARIVVLNFEQIAVYDHQIPSTLLDAAQTAFLDVLRLHKFQRFLSRGE